MADVKTPDVAQNFVVSVGQTVMQTEEQALSVYYQMQSFPELQKLLSLHALEITKALQRRDTNALIGIIQKVQSDFLRSSAEQPYQIQMDTEKRIRESLPTQEEITARVDNTKVALGETGKTAASVHSTKRKHQQEFIEKLVKNYSKLPPHESAALTNVIIATAETHPDIPPREIIQNASKTIPGISPAAVQNLQQQKDITRRIEVVQKNDTTIIEQQIIQAVLDSPKPAFTVHAIQTFQENTNLTDTADLIKKAQVLSRVDTLTKESYDPSTIDYSGFFSNISKNGAPVEKFFAPLADAFFSILPKNTQEHVVTKIIGTSWKKEISDNTFLQNILGPTLQSSFVQSAIQKGNQLFAPSGQKPVVFSQTQTFIADVFVTIFHPQVSEIYLQLAQLNNTQMSQSVGHFYLGLLADRGATYIVKQGVVAAGKTIASKTGNAAIGKVVGTLAGGVTANPLVGAVASLVGDKILGGIWNGIKKGFGFLSSGIGRLVSGNYEIPPLTKDPAFIASAILVGTVTLLFVIPILPLTVTENSLSQQIIQDNAYIQGLGTGDETGPAIDCGAEPANPLCSMKSCDTSTQDCRWPTSGEITQGPYTSCGGTHSNANAIDIGGASGADVYATITGTVSKVSRGCMDDTGFLGNMCGGYLGNYVVIKGTCGGGTSTFSCTLTFGHLKRDTIRVSEGQSVQTTDVIGEMDHTGNSTGTHLHFSMKDTSHSINEILPFAIGHCVNGTSGCTPCSYPQVGGGK